MVKHRIEKLKNKNSKLPWYINGLHFQCARCGCCCSGPDEGYIWINRPEMEFLAKHLDINLQQLNQKYLKQAGLRKSIIEHPLTKDCIFLTNGRCSIYNTRPSQCRTWPFWPGNLKSPDRWNLAAVKCPGINKGRLYTYGQIEKIKNQKCWWKKQQ